jgi:hypothetical protein
MQTCVICADSEENQGGYIQAFDFGVTNINPTMTVTLPSGGSPAIVTPPILGEYTSMLFQV